MELFIIALALLLSRYKCYHKKSPEFLQDFFIRSICRFSLGDLMVHQPFTIPLQQSKIISLQKTFYQ